MSVHQMRQKEPETAPDLAVISRIVERARERARLMKELKEAYLRDDRERVHELLSEYFGVSPERSDNQITS